jgi:hypothetical protein
VASGQGSGRFDLAGRAAGVLYLAETPDHAIAEVLQGIRGQSADVADLLRWGRRIALSRIELAGEASAGIADLCDPEVLVRYRIAPDRIASLDRGKTQRIALDLLERGHAGLRWWSAFGGDWHGVVLFREALTARAVRFGEPQYLTFDHPALREAAVTLDVRLPG